MNNTELRLAFDTLLKKYHERGINIRIKSDADMSYYPTITINKSARGFVNQGGQRALDVLFDIGRAEKLIAAKIGEEDLDLKAREL
jgi:hypothetical protein